MKYVLEYQNTRNANVAFKVYNIKLSEKRRGRATGSRKKLNFTEKNSYYYVIPIRGGENKNILILVSIATNFLFN